MYGAVQGVVLGPLTSTVLDRARWRGQDDFPSSQEWADEVERILSFAHARGQFTRPYLSRLIASVSQRDSALEELRVAFFFDRNSFRVLRWNPIGAKGMEGEFTISGPSLIQEIFVEVKSPGWESELSRQEIEAGRKSVPKYINGEARWFDPAAAIRFAIDKAYPKFRDDQPNLAVIADDLFVSLQHGTDLSAWRALYGRDGVFTNSDYENLEGVGIFWTVNNDREIWYRMRLFLNPNARAAVRLPEDFRKAFTGQILISPPSLRNKSGNNSGTEQSKNTVKNVDQIVERQRRLIN
jgi:hypothetical protein